MFYLEIIFSSHTLKKKINRQPYFHFTPQFLVQGVGQAGAHPTPNYSKS